MAGWVLILIGLGVGMVGGFFLASLLGLSKEQDRQAEVDFLRMRLAEYQNREYGQRLIMLKDAAK